LIWIKGKQRSFIYARVMQSISSSAARAACPSAQPGVSISAVARALFLLTKPRLASFSVLSGMAGYAVVRGGSGWWHACLVFFGIALSAGGALSLNQWWERKTDALMRRTAGRPLPRGQVSPGLALAWSLGLSAGGVASLGWLANGAAASLALATIMIYGLVYTPLKRRTRWATEIGSVSGALPPLLGAAAAGEPWSRSAWVLAAVILFWQMPHFFAVGWMYREDYRAAGFPLLPAIDPGGARTAAWSFAHSFLLCGVSVASWASGWAGPVFGVAAVIGGAAMLWASWRFWRRAESRDREGRRLFFTTILYLPPVMAALVLDCI
jgi:heme o synthase